MAARALIVFATLLISGCQHTSSPEERLDAAAQQRGSEEARSEFPTLPEACTVRIGRVRLSQEPWVLYKKRVDGRTDWRDRKASECEAWGLEMKKLWSQEPSR